MMLFQALGKSASRGLRTASHRSALYSTERVFPTFSIYGSDSAFQVSPNAPQYISNGNYLKIKRVGAIMLSWAKSTNSGYNYQNKTFFSLSPSEVGLVLELLDSRIPKLSLTHSPSMSEDDKNTKELHITRTSGPDGNPLITIKVKYESEAIATLRVGETRVLKELLIYSLPRLLGYHSTLEGPLNVEGGSNGGLSQSGGNSYSPRSNTGYRGSNDKPPGEWPF